MLFYAIGAVVGEAVLLSASHCFPNDVIAESTLLNTAVQVRY